VPRLCEVDPGVCRITEERAQKNLSQDGKNLRIGKTSVWIGKTSVWIGKTPVRIENPHSG